MNSAVLLGLVLLASFGLVSLVLSGLLTLAWRAGLERIGAASLDLLGLRLLPAAGALLVALAVVLPAFLAYEPHRERETAGPLLIGLAAFAGVCLAHGIWRGWRACRAARALLRRCGLHAQRGVGPASLVHVVDVPEPLIAVIGAWRPRVVAAESVRAACDPAEFAEVLAHEAAHLAAWDNLKLLLLVAAPDVLAWTALGGSLAARWRAAAEREADQRATGDNRERRLALASALIKVARLLKSADAARPALGMPVATDDVPGRVRGLLGPPARPVPARILVALAGCAFLIPLLALPRYALLHELLEQLVRFGR
jgi:Zn-dependent protease with chaperone function